MGAGGIRAELNKREVTMKYSWLREKEIENCGRLSQWLGVKVNSITQGDIIVGYDDDVRDEAGNPLPITKWGIEIEFDTEPTAEQLEKIDVMLKSLKRTDGITADAHWAIVDSFNPTSEKPLRVTRRSRLIDCYVTQSVVALYLAGQLSAGDMVVGIFVDGDIDKPLIVDKIYRP